MARVEGTGIGAKSPARVVTAVDGTEIVIPHDTICIHSDMQNAVARLRAIRAAWSKAGVPLSRRTPTRAP